MDLELLREYFPEGTNGELFMQGAQICYTIELPWLNNEFQISCIPEGKYPLVRRYNKEFGWHLLVKDVPNRKGILLHAANKALLELKGCIAPVTKITDHGCGNSSKNALRKLIDIVVDLLEKEKVYLIISKK
jgi:hypothetical protein